MRISQDLRLAWVALIATVALASTACGPQSALQDKPKLPPYLNTIWTNNDDGFFEHLDLQFVSLMGNESMMQYRAEDPITGTVTCRIGVTIVGGPTDWLVTNVNRSLYEVEPIGINDMRCEWLKSMTRFGILGQKLTISYDNGQQMRVFDWNPPSQN